MDTARARGIFVLRIILGWGFLFAGMDKVLQLTGKPFSAAGFLSHATGGTWPGAAADTVVNPTHGLWVGIAGNAGAVGLINFLVQFGEIAIGLALILGIATRFAGIMGAIMTGLFYVASWDFGNGIVNEQLLFAVLAGYLAYVSAGRYWGLDAVLAEKTAVLRRTPVFGVLISFIL
jgi:thiosulfate dehydrogenase (quinone) large subunit